MARDHGRHLDGEFVGGRRQVIVTEVEVTHGGVAIHGVDDVTSPLEIDSAMTDVEDF